MSDPRTDLSAATAFESPWGADGWPTALPSSTHPSAALATGSERQPNSTPIAEAAAEAAQVPTLSNQVPDDAGAGGQGGADPFDEPAADDQPMPLSEADAAEIIGEWDGANAAASDGEVRAAADEDIQTSGEAPDAAHPYGDPGFDDAAGAGRIDSSADEVIDGIDVDAVAAATDAEPVPAEWLVGSDPSNLSATSSLADAPSPALGEPIAGVASVPAEADWFPSADAPPVVPLYFVGFCLGCGYNLRGLGAARCPECGRIFRPTDPRSYSPAPGGGPGKAEPRPKPWPRPSPAAAAPTFPWSAGTTVDRVAWLERRVRQLALRNGELEGMVRGLIDVMAARGMLTADDLFEIVPAESAMDADESAAEVADALTQVTDDTPLNAEADVESAALRELQRAVRQRRRV